MDGSGGRVFRCEAAWRLPGGCLDSGHFSFCRCLVGGQTAAGQRGGGGAAARWTSITVTPKYSYKSPSQPMRPTSSPCAHPLGPHPLPFLSNVQKPTQKKSAEVIGEAKDGAVAARWAYVGVGRRGVGPPAPRGGAASPPLSPSGFHVLSLVSPDLGWSRLERWCRCLFSQGDNASQLFSRVLYFRQLSISLFFAPRSGIRQRAFDSLSGRTNTSFSSFLVAETQHSLQITSNAHRPQGGGGAGCHSSEGDDISAFAPAFDLNKILCLLFL